MKQKIIFSTVALLLFGFFTSFAQTKVTGSVKGKDGSALPGVNVTIKGTSKSTQTGFDGNFSIDASAKSTLVLSFIGFETKEIDVNGRSSIAVIMQDGDTTLQEVVLIGSRNPKRVVTESAVPVDVIDLKTISSQGPQTNLNQILNMVAPSFTSNTQTVADGTDHLDPAQLRGLGPDQVLVLVNGKRRHTSALVNINGTPGRGSVGTDLNAFPTFAVEKIEVLRDGASAQYGSDAIAGVINIKVKKDTKKLDIALFGGSNYSKGANDHRGGNDGNNVQLDLNYGIGLGKAKSFLNATVSLQMRDITRRANDFDGTLFNAFNAIEQRALNNGLNINSLYGNITNTPNTAQIISAIKTYAPQVAYFSAATQASIQGATTITQMQGLLGGDVSDNELQYRGLERRDFNMRIGQSSLRSAQVFLNAAFPISDNVELYAFGGTSNRTGESAGFYRKPNTARGNTALYPNGYLPQINSNIKDVSIAAGFRGKAFENWNFDVSNTFGKNSFIYTIDNTSNASLKQFSKTEFDAGSLKFYQNTANIDLSRKFDVLSGFNVAFGGEARQENFKITPGEPDSYLQYDINGKEVTPTLLSNLYQTDFFGARMPGGSQVFPGFRAANNTDKGRQSTALYADLELDVTKKWLVNAAVRMENYSDFGNTKNYKIASRYKITDNINLRGAISTGFRAPSLHQLYFNSTSTQTVGGVAFQIGTFSNDSAPAQILGIPNLKQEESQSASIGFTAKIPAANLTITADAYMIKIKDRVILTDSFTRPIGTFLVGTPQYELQKQFDSAGATAATFFANAIDTKSSGIDVVITHKINIGTNTSLKSDFAATFSQTSQDGDIKASPILAANNQINNYYSERSRVFLEEAVPRVKANLSNTLTYKKVDFFVRNVYFGKVTDPNTADVNGDGVIGAIIVNGNAVENEHPIWGAKIITDFTVGFEVVKHVKLVVGANNIFDIYPDTNLGPISAKRPTNYSATGTVNPLVTGLDTSGNIAYNATPVSVDLQSNQQFVYSRNVSQFGQNGRFVFARLNFKF